MFLIHFNVIPAKESLRLDVEPARERSMLQSRILKGAGGLKSTLTSEREQES